VGGTPRQLVEDAFEADLAPDGERLAFLRDVGRPDVQADAIYVAASDGREARELLRSDGHGLAAPAWAACGDRGSRGPHLS
jgi:hypothetical protein